MQFSIAQDVHKNTFYMVNNLLMHLYIQRVDLGE